MLAALQKMYMKQQTRAASLYTFLLYMYIDAAHIRVYYKQL